jgi:peptidoglycan/xylan/chitin deacetylase (PgdA/CDA1 family)
MYHHLDEEQPSGEFSLAAAEFRRQMHWLARRGFTTLTFDSLFAVLDGAASCPARPVMITFDDGYRSFADVAAPALAAHGMTATVFLVAGEIGGRNRWDEGRDIEPRPLMDATAIESIISRGFEIGVHGWRHRDLTGCSPAAAVEETAAAGESLRRRFNVAADVFAYPYGRHRPADAALLRQAGYRGAVSIFSTARTVTGNRYSMRRIHVHAGDTLLRFAAKLTRPYLQYAGWRDVRGATGLPAGNSEYSAHG